MTSEERMTLKRAALALEMGGVLLGYIHGMAAVYQERVWFYVGMRGFEDTQLGCWRTCWMPYQLHW